MTLTLSRLQRTTTIGILAACSIILYYFKFPVPFFPPFLTMDISDIPALIGAITLGPVLFTMYLLNYYFILPSIMELIGITKEQYVDQFTQFNPLATDFRTAVLYVIIPFNLLKIGMIYGMGLPFSFRLDRILNSKRKRVHV